MHAPTCMLSPVQHFEIPWTVAHQAPLSMEFSRQGYCSGLPLAIPGDLPDPGIEPASLASSDLATKQQHSHHLGVFEKSHSMWERDKLYLMEWQWSKKTSQEQQPTYYPWESLAGWDGKAPKIITVPKCGDKVFLHPVCRASFLRCRAQAALPKGSSSITWPEGASLPHPSDSSQGRMLSQAFPDDWSGLSFATTPCLSPSWIWALTGPTCSLSVISTHNSSTEAGTLLFSAIPMKMKSAWGPGLHLFPVAPSAYRSLWHLEHA